jgi:hypothetical protein
MTHKIDYVNEYLAKADRPVAAHIRCADGATLSVQASSLHHCTPKSDTGPWEAVEVWYIKGPKGNNVSVTSWREWGDGLYDPYGYVPIRLVNAFIKRHGGLETPSDNATIKRHGKLETPSDEAAAQVRQLLAALYVDTVEEGLRKLHKLGILGLV